MQLFEGSWKMSEWAEVPLGQLVDIFDNRRVPLSSTERMMRQGPFPYYGAQGVIDHIDDYIFDGRYILVPEDGENLRSRKSPIAYFAEGRFWVNNHAHIIKAKPHVAVDRFVQSALQATNIDRWVTGAAQPKLSQRNLKQIPIRIPSREVQQTIGAILDTFDDLIENNQRRAEALEEMARAIYREWFVKFRYPGHEDVPLVDSALGPIPEHWTLTALDDVIELDRTSIQPSQHPDTSFDHFSLPAFDEDQLPRREVGSSIKSSKFTFTRPVVLVSKLNPQIERTWLAKPQSSRMAVASTEFMVTIPKGGQTLEWLYLTVRSDLVRERLVSLSGGTSTSHQRTKPKDFLATAVPLPPAQLNAEFTSVVSPQLALVGALRVNNKRLRRLRDLLLPKLVTGQIDVSTLDLDSLTLTDSFGNDEVA